MVVDTPLLIVGGGPGALAAAEIASGYSLPTLVVGHVAGAGPAPDFPVALDADAVAALTPHGVLDVLRPYLAVLDPPTLSPRVFEEVLKQHSIADFNVTVYDGLEVEDRDVDPISGVVRGVLTDHRRRWSLTADAMIDTTTFPPGLSDTVNRAVAEVVAVLQQIRTGRAG
jgi:2-polyprenyl-6-methoxyphenol hydroxylase-like FAD-dependent oxidoreductase